MSQQQIAQKVANHDLLTKEVLTLKGQVSILEQKFQAQDAKYTELSRALEQTKRDLINAKDESDKLGMELVHVSLTVVPELRDKLLQSEEQPDELASQLASA